MTEQKKYVFIAGGIGITPFRSIIKECLSTQSNQQIILFYQFRTKDEILFKDIFDQAEKQIGLEVHYIESANDGKSSIDIERLVPNYETRYFYVSGPQGFVEMYRQKLMELQIPEEQIKTDLFTGYEF